jgi:hypothetical protein
MATVGQQLTAPEPGWKRYDDTDSAFVYGGPTGAVWTRQTLAGLYNSTQTYAGTSGGTIRFDFIGTKLRIIQARYSDEDPNMQVDIDGTIYNYSAQGTPNQLQTLTFEKTGLSNSRHTVTISKSVNAVYFRFDALDIDSTGRLLHPSEVTDPTDLVVGKRIRANYVATSGAVGNFSGLGKETANFIPATTPAAPNGDFYFIHAYTDYAGRKALLPDRNIQSTIAWDTLNTAGIASGSGLLLDLVNAVPTMTSNTSPRGTVRASDELNATYVAWKAFDGQLSTEWAPNGTTGWLEYEFTTPQIITRYVLQCAQADIQFYPKDWTIEAWNGSTWVVLDTRTNITSWASTTELKSFSMANTTAYTRYRINVSANGGREFLSIGTFQMFASLAPNNLSTIRLLTGGVSSTDKDNEWDTYIVNSTLNGTITAGDNNVWNWSGVASWASTTIQSATGASSNRVFRGNAASNTFNYGLSSTANTTTGFRPVLLIEPVSSPSITHQGEGVAQGVATSTATAGLELNGGTASMVGVASFTADATVIDLPIIGEANPIIGTGIFTANGDIVPKEPVLHLGSASMVGVSQFSAAPTVLITAESEAIGVSTATADSSVFQTGTPQSIIGAGVFSAVGYVEGVNTADIIGVARFTADGNVIKSGAGEMIGASIFWADGTKEALAEAHMTGVSLFTAEGTAEFFGEASFIGVSVVEFIQGTPLFHTILLTASRRLYTRLKGGFPVSIEHPAFNHFIGDSGILRITAVKNDDVEEGVLDLSGADIKWVLKRVYGKENSLVKSTADNTINVVDYAEGIFTIELLPADTANLKPGTYEYECEITDFVGHVSTVMTGQIVLKSSIT